MVSPIVTIQPDPRRKRAQVHVACAGVDRITLEILELGLRAEGPPGPQTLTFPDFVAWTPSTPQLYTLRCIPDGHQPVEIKFGMREVSVQEQRFTINQRPTLLKGARIGSLSSAEDATRVLTALRAAGVNWIPCSPETAMLGSLLDAADSLGMLISLALEQSVNSESVRELIQRIHHHPSLLFWEIDPKSEELLGEMRAADPVRPVVVRAVDEKPGVVFRPFQTQPERLEPVELRAFSPVSRETESFLSHFGHANAINMIGVRGFVATSTEHPTQHGEGIRICGERLRANPRVAAYCFDDALVAEGKTRDTALAALKDAHAPVRAVITLARTNLVPREEVEVSVILLNDAKLEGRAEMSLQVVGPTNQTLWKKKRAVKLPKHGKELWTGSVAASGSTGPHRFVVQIWTDQGLAGEGQSGFHVVPAAEPWKGTLDVLDPAGAWAPTIRRLAPQTDPAAQVILVPPLARTIRAYPENELAQLLARVREGAVALIFDPPRDFSELGATLSTPLDVRLASLVRDVPAGAAYVGRLHPLFEGLSAGGPLGRPYRTLLSARCVAGETEDDIAPVSGADGAFAGLTVRRFGAGRLVFTTLRLLERIGQDPVADHLFTNLLRYVERRALPSAGLARTEMKALEWLRHERGTLRPWRVIGPFPNPDGTGHATAYPPETSFEADAAYAGLFRALTWSTWHQGPHEVDTLNFNEAAAPNTFAASPLGGTYYAYSEITGDSRSEADIDFRHLGAGKFWLNGRLAYASADEYVLRESLDVFNGPAVLKQGRNTVLVKISVARGKPWFQLRFDSRGVPPGWRW